MTDKKRKKIKNRSEQAENTKNESVCCDFSPDSEIPTDTLGSYTGSPEDGGRPIQDADDL